MARSARASKPTSPRARGGMTRQGDAGSPRGRTTQERHSAIVVGMTTTTYAPSPVKPALASLPATALARLRGAATDAAPKHTYQRALYVMGALLVAAGLGHVVVWLVDGGAWAGPVSWRKPILFGLSLGMSALALGWVQGAMRRRRFVGWTDHRAHRGVQHHRVGVDHFADLAWSPVPLQRGDPRRRDDLQCHGWLNRTGRDRDRDPAGLGARTTARSSADRDRRPHRA